MTERAQISIFLAATSITSIVLAIVAITLALHHNKQANDQFSAVKASVTKVEVFAEDMHKQALDIIRQYILGGEKSERIPSADIRLGTAVPVPVHEVEGEIRSDVSESNSESEEARVAGIADSTDPTVSKFLEVAHRIDEGTAFSAEERDSAVQLAGVLAKRDPQTMPEVMIALADILSSFAAANLDVYVDLLDDMFHPATSNNRNLNVPILVDLGRRILTSDVPHHAVVERFQRHRNAAQESGDVVYALAPWAVYNLKNKQEPELAEAIEEIKKLPGDYREEVRDFMKLMSDARKWMRVPTPQGETVAQAYKQFLEEYENIFNE